MILVIDLEYISKNKLTLEDYLVCYCVFYKDVASLKLYVSNTLSLVGKDNVNKLVDLGYLVKVKETPTFDDLYATEKCQELLGLTASDSIFNELLKVYPKKLPNGRRLHIPEIANKERYLKAIKKNLNLHNLILKCVELEVSERTANGSINYMPMLSTYINQQRWTEYMDEVINNKKYIDNSYGVQDI